MRDAVRQIEARLDGPVGIAIAVLVTAYTYSRSSGLFPIFIGWLFACLAFVETALRLREFVAGDARLPRDGAMGLEAVESHGGIRELAGFAWVLGFLLAIWLAGFFVATGLFLFTFLRLVGSRSWQYAGGAALIAVGVVWFVFAFLLEYRLFSGVLFGA